MWNRLFLLAACALSACEFSKELPLDAPGPSITIGFAAGTSMADEKSMAHQIRVKISDVSPTDVTVKYQIEGGTASPPNDFDIVTPETMTIPAGELEAVLEVKVKADTDGTEVDETIKLVLVEPKGAQIAFGTEKHEVTIKARALPRVRFVVTASSAQEPADATIVAALDETSEFDITADYAVTSTNATSGVDYALANGSVLFPAGTQMVPITLDVLDDALDEDNESVLLTLTTSTNSFIDTLADKHTHTILDDQVDPPPTVQFQTETSTHAEGAGTVSVVVALSAPSGRTITVPFVVDAASSSATAGGVDFSVGTSITIPPGNPTGTIAVTLVDDTADEPAETFELDLEAAANATVTGQINHRVQIDDNDPVCFGANAAVDVCFDTAPTGTVALSGTIDTDGAQCAPTQPIGWLDTQDPACVIAGASVTVNGPTSVVGSRPLVLVAATSLTVAANLDAASHEGAATNGPGTPPSSCAGTAPQNNSGGGGGGAGGSFLTIGGAGGPGNNATVNGGVPAAAVAAPARLRPGCPGQKGGSSGGSQGGNPGKAGGALYLVAGGNLTISNGIVVNVSGAGGSASNAESGGGGGGSGGMLQIFAGGTLTTGNSTKLVANGGGGSGGGDSAGGTAGSDPTPTSETSPASGGSRGGSDAGDGGIGFALGTPASAGNPATGNNAGGGGGGGGGGYIVSNKALGGADTSAGLVVP